MSPLDEGVAAIRSTDRNFDPGEFAQGRKFGVRNDRRGFCAQRLRNFAQLIE